MSKFLTELLGNTVHGFFRDSEVQREVCKIAKRCGGESGDQVLETTLTGYTLGSNSAISDSDSILGAFGKLQGQIDAIEGTTNTPNIPVAATNSTGNIVDGSANVITRPLTAFAVGANTTILAADTILSAFEKAQGQINSRITLTSALTGYTAGANTALAATDTLLAAFGKVQGQITARALSTAIPVSANPTASLGLTVIDGVATTFMRSDAAPALSQAIAPTWTGLHNWVSAVVGSKVSMFRNTDTGATSYSALSIIANGTSDNLYLFSTSSAGSLLAQGWGTGAPAVAGSGLYSNGNRPFIISTNSAMRLMIDTTGSIFTNPLGVGVPAPIGRFHIGDGTSSLSSAAVNAGMAMTSNSVYGNRIYFENLAAPTSQRTFMIGNFGNVFSVNMMADDATSFLHANMIQVTPANVVSMSSLAGTGTRIVVASAAGVLSANDTFKETGTFPVQLDNITGGLVSGTVHYSKTGNIVTLYVTTPITSTGVGTPTSINSQSGEVPAALRPAGGGVFVPCYGILDNSLTYNGIAAVDNNGLLNIQLSETAGSRITRGATFVVGGDRGLGFGWSITYSTA